MSDVTTELAIEASDKAMQIARLKDDNAKLREQSERLFDKTLELATENSKLRELCKLCEREAENAKLRDGANAMRQLYEDELKHALAENAKLRELLRTVVNKYCESGTCDGCPILGKDESCPY